VQYELAFDKLDAPLVQWNQNVGQTDKIYEVGESVMLKPNEKKINLFTLDGTRSLIKGVEYVS
jgi:iron(III) transport system ATP-binding protein